MYSCAMTPDPSAYKGGIAGLARSEAKRFGAANWTEHKLNQLNDTDLNLHRRDADNINTKDAMEQITSYSIYKCIYTYVYTYDIKERNT